MGHSGVVSEGVAGAVRAGQRWAERRQQLVDPQCTEITSAAMCRVSICLLTHIVGLLLKCCCRAYYRFCCISITSTVDFTNFYVLLVVVRLRNGQWQACMAAAAISSASALGHETCPTHQI